MQEWKLKSPENSVVFALNNKPKNYLYNFDSRYIERRLKLQLNLNLKLIQTKFKNPFYSFDSEYIEDNLKLKKTLNTTKFLMNTAKKISPLSPFNNTNTNLKNDDNLEESECSSTEDVEMVNQEKEQQNPCTEKRREEIPPPPPEDEYSAWVTIEMKEKEESALDYQAIYDALLKTGLEETKVFEKKRNSLKLQKPPR